MTNLRRAGRYRLPAARDDRGSMPMALLVVVVGMAFGALLLPMLMTQNRTATFDTDRVQALQAAQTGIDVGTGLIRSAVSTDTSVPPNTGSAAQLPCGPLTGTSSGGVTTTYSVRIAYYTANPNGRSAEWLADPKNRMVCVSGYGVFLAGSPAAGTADVYVPSFALLTATGATGGASGRGRTLQATYVFQTSNTYSAAGGGSIRFPISGSPANYCMDAGANPVDGTAVLAQLCPADGQLTLGQAWYYNADLSLQLLRTKGNLSLNPNGNGLCLQSSGASVVVKMCPRTSDGTALAGQEWRSDDARLCLPGGACLTLPAAAAGTALTTAARGTNYQPIAASPTVGPGAAGGATNQLVNFGEFGRCLDVPNKSVSDGSTFMIIYPCKQKLELAAEWNQKFAPSASLDLQMPVTTQWRTHDPASNSDYCLRSPRVAGQNVTVVKCPTAADMSVTWTIYSTKDSDGRELQYADKFTIRDSSAVPLCMASGPETYPSAPPSQKVVVTPCDGSPGQKWNADPNVRPSRLQNTVELPYQPPS